MTSYLTGVTVTYRGAPARETPGSGGATRKGWIPRLQGPAEVPDPVGTGESWMADQQRWFKFWCSAPSDDDIQSLPVPDRWAWAVLGAYTKLHGTAGKVTVGPTNSVLAAEMGVTVEALIPCIQRLPHITVQELENRHGRVTVTWHNWTKYQVDSTQSERARASRAKKRREEKREEVPPYPPENVVSGNGNDAKAFVSELTERLSRKFTL